MKRKTSVSLMIIWAVAFGMCFVSPLQAKIWFVTESRTGGGSGNDWGNAAELKNAVESSQSGDEIWVKAGIHKPDASDPSVSFVLKSGVKVLGGFSGTEEAAESRNPKINLTILSGDIGGDDTDTDSDGIIADVNDIVGSNSYHVVKGGGTDSSTLLDGFVITGGKADGSSVPKGGGIYINSGSLTVSNCTFTGNSAEYGGGWYNVGGLPTLTRCAFNKNVASDWGGGVCIESRSPVMTDCTFTGNTANYGGGIYSKSISRAATMAGCVFTENAAVYNGGGIFNTASASEMSNCVFYGNSARKGGGIYNYDSSSPSLTNCLFSGNVAKTGGGIYNHTSNPTVINCTFTGNAAKIDESGGEGGGMANMSNSRPTISNSIFGGNIADTAGKSIYNEDSSPTVSHTLVEEAYGAGTITGDPLFMSRPDPGDDDWRTTEDNDYGDLHLQWESPAVDAGDNAQIPEGVTTDLEGNPRLVDAPLKADSGSGEAPIVDMGAYEYEPPSPPVISEFTPLSGSAGTIVNIMGSYFFEVISVQLAGTDVAFNKIGDTHFTVDIPEGAATGKISVTTSGGTAESADPFTVLSPPSITEFSPMTADTGVSVTITGTGFTGATAVKFGITGETPDGVDAESFEVDELGTSVTAVVPGDTVTGKIAVTTPGGTAESSAVLTIDETDDPPIVAEGKEIGDQDIQVGGESTEINLSDMFTDPDNENASIAKTVDSNTNPDVVAAEIDGDALTLTYQGCGTATITILADSNGMTVTDAFTVTVSPIPGDANCDRQIDLADAVIILKILAGMGQDIVFYNADADDDGRLGSGDVIFILENI